MVLLKDIFWEVAAKQGVRFFPPQDWGGEGSSQKFILTHCSAQLCKVTRT